MSPNGVLAPAASVARPPATAEAPLPRVGLQAPDPARRRRLAELLDGSRFAVQAGCIPVPDVVIVELSSTERRDLRTIRSMRGVLPAVRIVVVATPAREHDARLLIAAGADGLVPSSEAPQVLEATVHAVLAGQVCLPRDLRGHLAHAAFSHREKQVLELMAAGGTNRQIGESLYLTESTVKSHLASAFAKLGVRSRAEATLAIADEGVHL